MPPRTPAPRRNERRPALPAVTHCPGDPGKRPQPGPARSPVWGGLMAGPRPPPSRRPDTQRRARGA